jgi:hypothetical protein
MFPIVECEDFSLKIEEEVGTLFVHCDVSNFSKDVLTSIKFCWFEIKDRLFSEGFSEIFSYNSNIEFATLVDGDYTKECTKVADGKSLEVLKWELK